MNLHDLSQIYLLHLKIYNFTLDNDKQQFLAIQKQSTLNQCAKLEVKESSHFAISGMDLLFAPYERKQG